MLRSRAQYFVVLACLAIAYLPLTTCTGVVITDDGFTSDIANGEWPGRVETGRVIRNGEWPVWSDTLFGGWPLMPSQASAEPISLMLFTFLSPVVAVDAFIMLMLGIAACGTALFSRSLGASAAGAALAGLGYSFSGYMVCQLKHLAIISTIAWAPLALWLLLKAFPRDEEPSPARRRLALGAFALVYGEQWLCAFVQSAYNCTWLYIAWGGWLIWQRRAASKSAWSSALKHAAGFALAGIVGVGIGLIQLASLWQLAQQSERGEGLTLAWVFKWNYWLPQLWTFVVPYMNGDISDYSFRRAGGQGIFWEDYSYVGIVTLVFAFFAFAAKPQRRSVIFWWVTALVAMCLVLGRYTPLYEVAYNVLPGLKFFRFPQRFLFIVHFALSVLAGLGLTAVLQWLAPKLEKSPGGVAAIGWLVVGASYADLQFHQLRQNAIADADRWMETPWTVELIKPALGNLRVYSAFANKRHQLATNMANGWSNLEPFYEVRDLLQPDSNWLWNVSAAGGYAGLMSSSTGFLWGSSNTQSRVQKTFDDAIQKPELLDGVAMVLRNMSVKFVLSAAPLKSAAFQLRSDPSEGMAEAPITRAYELAEPAPRFFPATRVVTAKTNEAAYQQMAATHLAREHTVIVMDEQNAESDLGSADGITVDIRELRTTENVVKVSSPREFMLVQTDAFDPNWVATVDGTPTPILRVNVNQRAMRIPAGEHEVRLAFDSKLYRLAGAISFGSALVCVAFVLMQWRALRATSRPALS